MINKITKFITILAMTILLVSCSKPQEVEYIEPITIECNSISLDLGADFKLQDHCKILPETTLVSYQNEPEMQDLGTHTLRVILSDGKHNNLVIKDIDYEIVKPIPECPENSEYDEESEACICSQGYVNRNGEKLSPACELKAVCSYGYYYNEKTNSCYRRQTQQTVTQTPSQESTASNTPSDSSSGSSSSGSSTQASNPEPTPQPQPTPTPEPQPDPQPSGGAGSRTCSPSGNSQEALDAAYNACVAECGSHGNCSVYWDGSSYVASWN